MKLLLPLALASTVLLTGCSNPCTDLLPSPQEAQVVEAGGSVEREVGGTECELEDLDEGFQIDD